jgi:hypothetical protein
MAKEIGRNDPCPCGSGKKYKKCCLARDEAEAARRRAEGNAVATALAWLFERYPEAVDEAIHGDYMGDLADDEVDALNDLAPGLQSMLTVNLHEWLLTDAEIEVEGKPARTRDLLLGPGGPLLTAPGRQWIEALGERPLSLYEVREVKPGEGVEVQDLLRPDEPPFWVVEHAASRDLVRWDVVGARLARRGADRVFAGALYPVGRDGASAIRDVLLGELEGEDLEGALARDLVGAAIRDHWLRSLVAEPVMPRLVDQSTGEPILLTTDRYRVTDWPALEAALAGQPDVEGTREEGWVRFEPLPGEMRRSRATLSAKEPDGLEVFCRTRALADEARAWLKGLAGKALVHRGREHVDPRSPKAREGAAPAPEARLPPEVEARVVHEFMRRHYESWTEQPIPALGHKTPREAIRTPEGRQAVVDLLKSFEQLEARKARGTGGPPFDFGFLWERLGIARGGGGS